MFLSTLLLSLLLSALQGAGLIGALRLDPRVLLFLSIRPRLKHWRGRVAARVARPQKGEGLKLPER